MPKRETTHVSATPMEDVDDLIRRNLVKFIAESGNSANLIADTVGLTQASMSRYTRGENAVPANVLKPLADFFGRRVGDFYEEDPPPPDPKLKKYLFLKTTPGVVVDDAVMRKVQAAIDLANEQIREAKLDKAKKGKG